MEVAKTVNQEVVKLEVNNSTRHLLNSIKTNSSLEIEKNLFQYREHGIIKYSNLLSIPVKDRLPGLIEQYGAKKVHGILVVMLTKFCNSFNVIRPMTADQIVECANEILNTSHEDYLSIEDLAIFLSGAKAGKFGKIYDRLDQQMIFEMMEVYRQERHEQNLKIKEEKHVNLKSLGPQFRTSEDAKAIKELFHQANIDYYKNTHAGNDIPESKNDETPF